jgi:hypothetical protein
VIRLMTRALATARRTHGRKTSLEQNAITVPFLQFVSISVVGILRAAVHALYASSEKQKDGLPDLYHDLISAK